MADLSKIKGLTRKTLLTRVKLSALRLAEAFWPLLLLLALFASIALFGLFDAMSPGLAAMATLVTLAGGIVLFLRGRRRFAAPTDRDVRRALDAGSEDRPLSGLTDRPVDPGPVSQSLWRAHTERLRRAAEALPLPGFSAAWARLDPYWLRAIAPGVIVAGLAFANLDAGARLQRALFPDYGALLGAGTIRVEAWITPPDYARKPPVFLRDGLDEVRVPSGSEVTVRVQAKSAPLLRLRSSGGTRRTRFSATPDGAWEARAFLTADTDASVRWWGERASWSILTSPDGLPVARFETPPSLGENDRMVFRWMVGDDYGVERLELALALVEPHPAAPDEERRVTVELPGTSVKEATEDASIDMTRHPWAGLEVVGRLVATDGAGQEGRSAPATFLLLEKLFLQPLARATQDIRVTALREPRAYPDGVRLEANALEAAPEGIQKAAFMLEAVTYAPEKFFDDYAIYTGLANARGTLKAARTLDEAASVDGLLWAIALKAEYGSSADALAILLAARRALEQALREGASEEEIARLTQAFRQAAENYVQAKLAEAVANGLAEGAERDGLDNEQAGGDGQGLGQNSFEDMLNALEDLTQTGASDQARQLLSDITNMLENLEFQQGNGSGGDGFALPSEGGGEGESENQSEAQRELSESLEELADTLRDQRELNDDTLEAERRGTPSQPAPGNGESESDVTDLGALADRQRAIREQLEALQRRAGETGEDGEAGGLPGGEETERAVGEALDAQRRAEEALREGAYGRAGRNQEQAASRLRDIAGELADAIDALRGEEQAGAGTDPFGRPIGGANDSSGVSVPDEAERRRALDILEELRRRYGDPANEEEREYLERLLDRF